VVKETSPQFRKGGKRTSVGSERLVRKGKGRSEKRFSTRLITGERELKHSHEKKRKRGMSAIAEAERWRGEKKFQVEGEKAFDKAPWQTVPSSQEKEKAISSKHKKGNQNRRKERKGRREKSIDALGEKKMFRMQIGRRVASLI